MKNLTKTIISTLFAACLILPGISFASDQHTVVGTIKNYKVMEYQNDTAYMIIDMDANSSTYGSAPACSTKVTRFSIALDSAMIDQVTSIVMTAHISRLRVALKSPMADEGQQCHEDNQRLALVNVKAL